MQGIRSEISNSICADCHCMARLSHAGCEHQIFPVPFYKSIAAHTSGQGMKSVRITEWDNKSVMVTGQNLTGKGLTMKGRH